MNTTNSKFGQLNKAIYGLNQASRQFFRRITTYLDTIGFTKSSVEPCLLSHQQKQLYIAVYVDDLLIVGHNTHLTWFTAMISTEFEIRVDTTVTEYVGTQLISLTDNDATNSNEKTIYLHQTRLSTQITTDFADLLLTRKVKTPG